MSITDSTEHRAIVSARSWQDYSRDKGEAAIVFLTADDFHRPGYYVVKARRRDARGRITAWALPCAHRESIEAAQFALDAWAGRCVRGEAVSSDEMLHEFALAVEKGLVTRP